MTITRSQDITPKRFIFIDSLRAIASFAVFVCHVIPIIGVSHRNGSAGAAWINSFIGYGENGVSIFFVLSGFVITYAIGHHKVDLSYLGRFIMRRSIRLDPPYWCAIAIMTLWVLIRKILGNDPPATPTLTQIIAHLFYVQTVFGFPHINSVFWTLCLEVQLYLSFVAILYVVGWASHVVKAAGDARWEVLTIIVVFALSLGWPAGLFGGFGEAWDPRGPTRADGAPAWCFATAYKFLLGALIAYTVLGRLLRRYAIAAIVLSSVAMLISMFSPEDERHPNFASGGAAVVTAAAILAASMTNGLCGWLAWPRLLLLGTISYSFYLIHLPIIGFVLAVQKRTGLTSLPASLAFCGLAFALSVIAAFVMYRYVEKPSMRLAARLKQRSPTEPVQLAPDDRPSPDNLVSQSGALLQERHPSVVP